MPDFEAKITEVVEGVDKAPKGDIDQQEKTAIQNLLKLSARLKAFETGSEEQQRALNKAINDVAEKYEGLASEELRSWIGADYQLSVPETDPGSRRFGKPPKESEVRKAWERLDARQRNELLKEAMETTKTTPAQNRRLQQLEMIVTLVKGSQKIIEKGGKNLLEKAYKALYMEDEELKDYNRRVESFLSNKVPKLSLLIIKNPTTPIKNLLAQVGNSEIYDVYKKEGVPLDECLNSTDLIRQKTALVKFLRDAGDYQDVRFICEEVLGKDLDKAFKKNLDQKPKQYRKIQIGDVSKKMPVYADLYVSAQVDVYSKFDKEEKIAEIQKEDPSISYGEAKQEIEKFIESLVYQHYLHEKDERVLDYVNDTDAWEKWSPAKQEMWAEYKDSMGVGALDLSDESWDAILDELLVNAPLIIVSGGVAAGVRAGVSKGLSYGARAVLGATKMGQIAAKTGRIGRFASRAAGLALEGAVFEIANSGMRGEWLLKSPDWAQRIMWTTAALGMFKGAGKIGEKLVGKKGALEASMKKITNPHVRKGVEELIVKGHLEVAAMLTLGAIQSGVYNGSLEEFFDHFGEELFHAYVAIGSLKISGKGVRTLSGKSASFNPKKIAETIKKKVSPKERAKAKEAKAEVTREKYRRMKDLRVGDKIVFKNGEVWQIAEPNNFDNYRVTVFNKKGEVIRKNEDFNPRLLTPKEVSKIREVDSFEYGKPREKFSIRDLAENDVVRIKTKDGTYRFQIHEIDGVGKIAECLESPRPELVGRTGLFNASTESGTALSFNITEGYQSKFNLVDRSSETVFLKTINEIVVEKGKALRNAEWKNDQMGLRRGFKYNEPVENLKVEQLRSRDRALGKDGDFLLIHTKDGEVHQLEVSSLERGAGSEGKDVTVLGFTNTVDMAATFRGSTLKKGSKLLAPWGQIEVARIEVRKKAFSKAELEKVQEEVGTKNTEEVAKNKESAQKTVEVDLSRLDSDIETNLRREIEKQKLEMKPEEVTEVIEAEKKFARDVVEKYEQWAKEKDATVLWDIDDTMGLGYIREGQGKFLFRPGILPLLAQLKARFPQIKNGLITDRPREQVLKELRDAEDLGPLVDFIESSLVFSSGKISRVLSSDPRYRQKSKELGSGYNSGAAEKSEMLSLIKGGEDALARQKSQEHPRFQEHLEPYLSQVKEPIPNAKIIDDYAAVKNPEHDGLWVNPLEYNAYARSTLADIQFQ